MKITKSQLKTIIREEIHKISHPPTLTKNKLKMMVQEVIKEFTGTGRGFGAQLSKKKTSAAATKAKASKDAAKSAYDTSKSTKTSRKAAETSKLAAWNTVKNQEPTGDRENAKKGEKPIAAKMRKNTAGKGKPIYVYSDDPNIAKKDKAWEPNPDYGSWELNVASKLSAYNSAVTSRQSADSDEAAKAADKVSKDKEYSDELKRDVTRRASQKPPSMGGRGGRAVKGSKRAGGRIARAAAGKFAKISGYEPVGKKGKKGKKGNEEEK